MLLSPYRCGSNVRSYYDVSSPLVFFGLSGGQPHINFEYTSEVCPALHARALQSAVGLLVCALFLLIHL